MNEPTESMSSTDVNAIFKSVREHQLRDLETHKDIAKELQTIYNRIAYASQLIARGGSKNDLALAMTGSAVAINNLRRKILERLPEVMEEL